MLMDRDDDHSINVTSVILTDEAASVRARLSAAIESGELADEMESEGLDLLTPGSPVDGDTVV